MQKDSLESIPEDESEISDNNISAKDKILTFALKELESLLPAVVDRLYDYDHLDDFINLLKLIAADTFPMKNISFLLLLEVARWYALTNTNLMHYRDETMLFFRVGMKLFHGAFVRFMSGGKSEGQQIGHDSTTSQNPQNTIINFAVPSISLLF